jgi:hypothetical protein
MPSKKRNISLSISRKKRCKNGSRRDKKTNECISFMPYTTFDKLDEQEIANEGITISIESLDDDGAITKIYNNKVIIGQKLIDNSIFDKAKKKSAKDFKRILKIINKSKKTPNFIKKDKEFQNFLNKNPIIGQEVIFRETMGGATKKTETKPKLIVQSKVIDKMSNTTITKLKDKITLLEKAIKITSNNNNRDWWSYLTLFNLFELVSLTVEYSVSSMNIKDIIDINKIPTSRELTHVALLTAESNVVNNQINNIINPIISYDFAGGLILLILDIVNSYFPSSSLAYITEMTQYIYWTWLIGSTFFVLMPINIWWGLASFIPFFASINYGSLIPMNIYKLEQLEADLIKTKLQLAKEIEKLNH